MSSSDLSLHEALMLLTLKDREGTTHSGTMYTFAVGGAVLAELLLTERIGLEGEGKKARVVVRDAPPTGDPLVDEWLEKIRDSRKKRTLMDWVGRIAGTSGLKHTVARQLCRRGILRTTEDKVLWIFTRKIYPEVDPGPERALTAQLEEAVFGEGEVTPRTAVLVALADQGGILRALFGRKRLKERKERLEALARGDAVSEAAQAAIEAMQVALMASAAIPAIVTTTVVTS